MAHHNEVGNLTAVKKLMLVAKEQLKERKLWASFVDSIIKVEDE